jgi:hypothetical protein
MKLTAEQRAALSHGPVYRSHFLKTELITKDVVQERALRFFSSMQSVTPPSPPILMPLFILLCQQMTLLVKSLDKGSRKASPGIVFQVRPCKRHCFCCRSISHAVATSTCITHRKAPCHGQGHLSTHSLRHSTKQKATRGHSARPCVFPNLSASEPLARQIRAGPLGCQRLPQSMHVAICVVSRRPIRHQMHWGCFGRLLFRAFRFLAMAIAKTQ